MFANCEPHLQRKITSVIYFPTPNESRRDYFAVIRRGRRAAACIFVRPIFVRVFKNCMEWQSLLEQGSNHLGMQSVQQDTVPHLYISFLIKFWQLWSILEEFDAFYRYRSTIKLSLDLVFLSSIKAFDIIDFAICLFHKIQNVESL